jgi:hypothetical protein
MVSLTFLCDLDGWDLTFVICVLSVSRSYRLRASRSDGSALPKGINRPRAAGSKGHWLPDCPEYGEIAATKATAMGTRARGRMNSLLWRLDLVRSASRPRVRVN